MIPITPESLLPSGLLQRRRFLAAGTASLVGAMAIPCDRKRVSAAEARAKVFHGPITIRDIEVHEIAEEYQDWLAYPLNHYYGPGRRAVYVVHTDGGLVGLGEGHEAEPDEVLEKYIGSSPFDWVGDETSLALGTAMYDLMGQAAGIPVYKLFGQRRRQWVPTAAWTVSTHPDRMVEAVKRYSARGFTWMKFHLSPFENILDQMEAMQAVAPEGFKVHFDFTMHGTNDHMFELLEKMGRYPIAGCFEDPLQPNDIEGYAELRRRVRLPVVLHHSPLGATFEVTRRAADAYMLGHARIGTAIRRSGLFASAGIPFMLQNTGGHITQAMTCHMQSAMKTANFHFISLAETRKSDVVHEQRDPVNGFLRVSERPGLGVTLNRAELDRLRQLKLPPQPKWILKTRYKNGTLMYNIADTKNPIFMVLPIVSRLIPMSYDAPLATEYWDNDGSSQWQEMFARIEREGVVLLGG